MFILGYTYMTYYDSSVTAAWLNYDQDDIICKIRFLSAHINAKFTNDTLIGDCIETNQRGYCILITFISVITSK